MLLDKDPNNLNPKPDFGERRDQSRSTMAGHVASSTNARHRAGSSFGGHTWGLAFRV